MAKKYRKTEEGDTSRIRIERVPPNPNNGSLDGGREFKESEFGDIDRLAPIPIRRGE